jgi:hypothetical protein
VNLFSTLTLLRRHKHEHSRAAPRIPAARATSLQRPDRGSDVTAFDARRRQQVSLSPSRN